jgi:tetratricopeptide (TPR) repeat protein
LRRALCGLLFGLGLLLTAATARADEWTTAFDQANALYERGQHAEALAAYTRLLGSGRVSAALYYNLGNAAYKAGQVGRALLYYRYAERLAPRDPDIQANLRFTRAAVLGGPPDPPPLWRRLPPRLTLDRWTVLTAVLFWVALGLLAAVQVRPAWKAALVRAAALAGIGWALAGAGVYAIWHDQCGTRQVIVVRRDAVLRHGPLEESPSLQTLRDGQELVVLDEKGGWLQVAGAARGVGWIQRDNVVEVKP